MIAACAIVTALWQLLAATEGLVVERTALGSTPVTIFRPASPERAPVILVAHGFAGSQQLMHPFAITLARSGYVAVTFDFLGHGRNPVTLRGSVTDGEEATDALLAELGEVADFARFMPESDGRLAVLGHSMASDIVVRHAQANPDVAATVAVSMFSPAVTATSPRNLLVIVGALEPGLKEEGLRVVALGAAEGRAVEGATYGSFADGTARRVAFADGVEHIGVLYSAESLTEARDWLNAAFGRTQVGPPEARGRWLGLLILGLIVLAWPLARLLPRVADRRLGASLPWRRLLPLAIAPALVTPLILWSVPTDFLPIVVGDYLAAHFALYGVLTAAGLALVGSPRPPTGPVARGALAASIAAATAYAVAAFGLPIDLFATSFLPVPVRLPLLLAVLAGTLPYFLADEWLTRGEAAPGWSYAATKLCFCLSLAIAVALDLRELFFLIIVVPVILVLFVVYGLLSAWTYHRTNHPFVAGCANAVAFAWAIAATFPLVQR